MNKKSIMDKEKLCPKIECYFFKRLKKKLWWCKAKKTKKKLFIPKLKQGRDWIDNRHTLGNWQLSIYLIVVWNNNIKHAWQLIVTGKVRLIFPFFVIICYLVFFFSNRDHPITKCFNTYNTFCSFYHSSIRGVHRQTQVNAI